MLLNKHMLSITFNFWVLTFIHGRKTLLRMHSVIINTTKLRIHTAGLNSRSWCCFEPIENPGVRISFGDHCLFSWVLSDCTGTVHVMNDNLPDLLSTTLNFACIKNCLWCDVSAVEFQYKQYYYQDNSTLKHLHLPFIHKDVLFYLFSNSSFGTSVPSLADAVHWIKILTFLLDGQKWWSILLDSTGFFNFRSSQIKLKKCQRIWHTGPNSRNRDPIDKRIEKHRRRIEEG